MGYFILSYDLTDDYLQRRGAFRAEHLSKLKPLVESGELSLGGALADPADTAVLVFQGEDDSAARDFAENDPYVLNGLVNSWSVREWTVVIGADYDGAVPGG